jgi:hypothetical protein
MQFRVTTYTMRRGSGMKGITMSISSPFTVCILRCFEYSRPTVICLVFRKEAFCLLIVARMATHDCEMKCESLMLRSPDIRKTMCARKWCALIT